MRERGCASVEWVALLAVVVGALLAAVGSSLGVAPSLPRAVAATFERAFCLVSGGDCLGGRPRPCVVRSHERSRERRASVAVLRLADGRTVLREDRSDGTVVLTVEDVAGAGARVGATAGIGGAKASVGVGGDARGGRGRRFVVAGGPVADRLLARLGEEHAGARGVVDGGDEALVVDERWWAVGSGAEAEAELRIKGLGGDARLDGTLVAAVRERPRTGEMTVVLRNESELMAVLSGPLARLAGGTTAEYAAELGLDRDGEPVALTVRVARGVHGDVTFGPLRSGGGDRVEAEARLDLTDPGARALARDLLKPSRGVGAARALAGRLAERARIDVRLYATDRREKSRGAGLGLLGYEVVEVDRTGRLVDAYGREPGMGWVRRIDCVGVA